MRISWRGFELPTQVQVDPKTKTGQYAMFVAEPFERGYGFTIGNSLRRVLISSLEGAAVTSIRVAMTVKDEAGKPKTLQAAHEFTALPGLYEDVTALVLNVKEIRLRIFVDEPIAFKLEKSGKGPITAGDIQRDDRFEIVNPSLVLCNLADDSSLAVHFTACRGRGYRVAEQNRNPEAPAGVIAVDSVFSPAKRVRYRVENTRMGQRTDYDRLVLELWTDGTLDPELAMVEAATILRKHFNPFVKYFELGRQIEAAAVAPAARLETGEDSQIRELREKLKLPISVLDPSARAENSLSIANIHTLAELVKFSEADLLKVKNFGKTSMKEIKKKLADLNLSLGMELPPEAPPPAPSA
jgi:DNA-directed RNA polymerase subunit alpha